MEKQNQESAVRIVKEHLKFVQEDKIKKNKVENNRYEDKLRKEQ